MSASDNRGGFFIDTELLRDHVSKLRENKKTATKLYENVMNMKMLDEPTDAYRYSSILWDIEQLIEYFDRMAMLLNNVSDDAVELSHKLRSLIQDDTENVRQTISNNFLL